MLKIFVLIAAALGLAHSQAQIDWGQCGGMYWTGAKSCSSNAACVTVNIWYSQCIPYAFLPAQQQTAGSNPTQPATSGASSVTSQKTTPKTTPFTPSAACGNIIGSSYQSKGDKFINGKFSVGVDYNYYLDHVNKPGFDFNQYDHVTIWMDTIDKGSTQWNQWYQGEMLKLCKANNKIPVFYAYVIAFEARNKAGLQDCDVAQGTPSLCTKGSQFIRDNRDYLIGRYADNAQNIANTYGTDRTVVFKIEPDFWQYFGDSKQEGGGLSGDYMVSLFNSFVAEIKKRLPNALISFDISAWIDRSSIPSQYNFHTWWSYFKDSEIDFVHTSGGQARGDLANIKQDELLWKCASQITGKKIIADCGYGVAGKSDSNCDVWAITGNQNARISDGVVALSETTPSGYVAKPSVSL